MLVVGLDDGRVVGASVEQVADVVQQRGRDLFGAVAGLLGQGGGLQGVLGLADRLAEVGRLTVPGEEVQKVVDHGYEKALLGDWRPPADHGMIFTMARLSRGGFPMLLVGRHRTRTCQGLSRRALLQVGASTVLGLSLADLLRRRSAAGAEVHGTAKSVLLLWLWGGPAQLDTWDPKPNAPLEFRGPFSAIPTRITGVRFGELFPQVAAARRQVRRASARCTPAPTITASPAPSA